MKEFLWATTTRLPAASGAGLAVLALPTLLLLIGQAQSLAPVVAGWALVTLGSGPMVVLSVDMVIGSAPPTRTGAAAALNETGSQLGFALGIAVLGSLSAAVYRARIAVPSGVPAQAASASRDSLAGAVAAAHGLPTRIATALLRQSRDAFTSGVHVTATVSAVLLCGVAIAVIILLRRTEPAPPAAGTAEADADEHLIRS